MVQLEEGKRNMRTTILLALAAISLTATASAATPSTRWTAKDMKTAIRALSYPKPHPVRLTCTGQGAAEGSGRFTSFRCTATYRHHVRRRFVIASGGEGGWLCAGKTLAGCAVLRHGFVTTAAVSMQGLGATVDLAARGYAANRYGSYQVTHFCEQTTSTTWSCGFTVATVTITLKAAKGGYVVTATS